MHSKRKLHIALFGNDGQPPMFDGLRDEPSIDIFLFRAKAVGGKKSVRKIMSYYGIPDADIERALSEDTIFGDYELVSFESEHREDIREIRIKFKETV